MRTVLLPFTAVVAAALAACAASSNSDFHDARDGGAPPDAGDAGTIGEDAAFTGIPLETLGPGATDAHVVLFKKPAGPDAPFEFDPPSGSLLPPGWPSPSFLVHTAEKPWLVRVEVDYGTGVAAYTAEPVGAPQSDPTTNVSGAWWTVQMPKAIWSAIRAQAQRATWRILYALPGSQAPDGAASGTLEWLVGGAAPDMSYWEIRDSDQFSIQRLRVGSALQTVVPPPAQCIGCHASSPDGLDVAMQSSHGAWRVSVVRPKANAAPDPSPILTPAASALLDETSLATPATSAGAWSNGVGRWIAAVQPTQSWSVSSLALVQVDAPSPTVATFAGKAGTAYALPAFAPDGKSVVVVAGDMAPDGRTAEQSLSPGWYDLVRIPVQLTKDQPPVFGAPQPLPFVSQTPELETYPSFSPDGELLAFMRAPKGTGAYDTEEGEVYVVRTDFAAPPMRIAANSAPTDASVWSGKGLTSSWPRFGEQVVQGSDGSKYYALVMSSRRGSPELWKDRTRGPRPLPRLVLSYVRVPPQGAIQSYPGAIVPGQRVDAGAHTATVQTVTSLPPPPVN